MFEDKLVQIEVSIPPDSSQDDARNIDVIRFEKGNASKAIVNMGNSDSKKKY